MKLYLNGQIIPSASAVISCEDRAVLFGDGIFETLRIKQGTAPLLSLHWQRLHNSAKILGIPLSYSSDDLAHGIQQLLHANHWQQATAGIRITLTRGCGTRSLVPQGNETPQLMMQLFELPPPFSKGVKLHLASMRRNETSPLAQIKSLNYLDNILAQQQALQHHADAALLLNTQGSIACANFANIFLIKQQQLFTPPLTDGALPGITRQRIIEICLHENIPIHEQSLTLDMLTPQDSLWLTNSLRGIIPVIQLDDVQLTDAMQLREKISTSLSL